MSKQPRDDGNDPIPVLAFKQHRGYQVPFTTSANTSPQISDATRVVTLYSTVNAFFETGPATIVANTSNSHFIPAQIPYDISLGADNVPAQNDKYISIIATTGTGVLYISERD